MAKTTSTLTHEKRKENIICLDLKVYLRKLRVV